MPVPPFCPKVLKVGVNRVQTSSKKFLSLFSKLSWFKVAFGNKKPFFPEMTLGKLWDISIGGIWWYYVAVSILAYHLNFHIHRGSTSKFTEIWAVQSLPLEALDASWDATSVHLSVTRSPSVAKGIARFFQKSTGNSWLLMAFDGFWLWLCGCPSILGDHFAVGPVQYQNSGMDGTWRNPKKKPGKPNGFQLNITTLSAHLLCRVICVMAVIGWTSHWNSVTALTMPVFFLSI